MHAANVKAAERQERITALKALLDSGILSLGTPEADFKELITNGISPVELQKKATELEAKLTGLEKMKVELVSLIGENGFNWEKAMQKDVRPKIWAVLEKVEAKLKDVVLVSSSMSASSSGPKSTTKREPITLSKFWSQEKPDQTFKRPSSGKASKRLSRVPAMAG